MRHNLFIAAVATAAIMTGLGQMGAQATPIVIGGPLTATQFMNASIDTGTYSYLGSSTSVFTGTGSGTMTLAESTFSDTFGYANASYGAAHTVFVNSTDAPSTATISPSYSPFVFFFATGGSGGYGQGADSPATLYSDGHTNGTDGGQANLAIYKSTTGQYAFFFDDGGPSGTTGQHGGSTPIDDNDWNDMVVTYTPTAIPEPLSLAVLGIGIFGLGLIRSRRHAV
jgi:hypothetical protein